MEFGCPGQQPAMILDEALERRKVRACGIFLQPAFAHDRIDITLFKRKTRREAVTQESHAAVERGKVLIDGVHPLLSSDPQEHLAFAFAPDRFREPLHFPYSIGISRQVECHLIDAQEHSPKFRVQFFRYAQRQPHDRVGRGSLCLGIRQVAIDGQRIRVAANLRKCDLPDPKNPEIQARKQSGCVP